MHTQVYLSLVLLISCFFMMSLQSDVQWKVIEELSEHMKSQVLAYYDDKGPTDPSDSIVLIFATKQNNIENLLSDISNPDSSNYGKHLTKEEADKATLNPHYIEKIKGFLQEKGADVIHVVSGYVHANATVGVWNQVLNTEFHTFSSSKDNKVLVRTLQYSLPIVVSECITGIFNTVQFPSKVHHGPVMSPV